MKRMSTEQLLGANKFIVDDHEAHIVPKREVCAACPGKPCVYACPAGLYVVKDGEISFDCAGCLECGTCRVVCPRSSEALGWKYPRGGFGVSYRYG